MKARKSMAWIGGAMAAFILIVVIGALLVQQSTFGHRYILAKMIQAGEKSSGAEISIRNFEIRWIPLRLSLQDVVVRSREETTAPPLATLPEVQIGLSWDELLHKKIDLTELVLDRPAVNLMTNAAGEINLPERQSSTSAPSSSKFNVAVRHAAVRDGEFRYNNLARKLDADLSGLHLDVNHNAAANQYTGNLGYSSGEIAIDGHGPWRHGAQINFAATDSGIIFEKIHVATESSQLNAKGSMQGFSHPIARAEYQIALSSADLRRELHSVQLSGGEIELTGSLSYDAAAGSGLAALKTSGRVSSSGLATDIAREELNLRSITGDYSLEGGNLHVSALRAETMGGVLRAEFSAEGLTATPRYRASMSAESLSLGQAAQVAGATTIPLRGTARLEANARWVSSLRNTVARADAGITATINSTQAAADPGRVKPLPLNGALHVAYDAPHATITVTNSTFASPQTNITANGTVSDHSALSVRARSSNLHETDLLIVTLRNILSTFGKTAQRQIPPSAAEPLNLRGTASVDLQIAGRIQNPRITGHAQADGLQIRHATWPHIQADFDASSSSLSVKNGAAQSANNGHLNFALATQLQSWSYSAENPLTAHVDAAQIPVADFEQLTGFSEPVFGMIFGNVSVHGTIDHPAGGGTVELRNASVWGEPVRSVAAQIQAANKTISASFRIAAAAGTVDGNGEFDAASRQYGIAISHTVLDLAKVQYLSSRGYHIAGTLGIEAHGQGTLNAPQLEVALSGNKLAFRNVALGSINAQVQVANEQANFAIMSEIAGGQINANGNAGIAAPYMAHGGFEVRSLQFGPLLAAYAPSVGEKLQGDAEVRGQIEGPLARPEEVKATVELSTLNLAYENLRLASAGPVRLNYADSVLTISQAELKGTGTDFKFGGTLPLKGAAPMNISTTGLVDLKLLTILGSNTQSSGTVKIDLTARGAVKKPQLGGTIELAKASFISDTAPLGVEDVNGRIAVANNRLTIENFSGQMGGGTFSVSGVASYAPVSFSLQVNGKSVRIRYPQGTRTQLDAGLTFTGTPAKSILNGRVAIDQLSFTPDFDLANFVGQFTSSAPSVPSPWEENTRLDVAVASSDVLALSSSQLSLQGSVNVRVAGTLANPVVLGRTTLTGGSLIFLGNVYQVQSGTVVFANPIRTEPTLNLYVTTLVEDYNITLNFVGTLDRLRTNYTSDPVLPPVDIIHLLAFGKTTEQSAATATPASLGAESVIANGLASQVSNRIEKLTGISQIEIDPSLGGNNSDPGARLAIQERVSSNILFTFATDLTNTQNEVVQVRYQTRGSLSFSLTRDEYGSYAIQVKTHKSF